LVVNFSSDLSAWVLDVPRTFSVPETSSQDFSIAASEELSLPFRLGSSMATCSWSANSEAPASEWEYRFYSSSYILASQKTGRFFSGDRSGYRRSKLLEGI